jgi:hypothetical protein
MNLEKLAKALIQGEGQKLIQMTTQLHPHTNDNEPLEETINNEMVQHLKQIYDKYVKQNMPFVEQVRLISLLPRSWGYDKIMQIFGCTRHAVKAVHRMHEDVEYQLKKHKEPSIRQRADPQKIKHFVSWLVESNTLVSGRTEFIHHL